MTSARPSRRQELVISSPRKPTAKAVAANPYLAAANVEDLTSANRIAYEIVAARRDVLASVERIMNAGLEEPVTVEALSLFQAALGDLADANRDPRVAMATATARSEQ